jgi:hypothetical protein
MEGVDTLTKHFVCKIKILMVHTCHPSYSGGRDQEDCGLKQIVCKTLPQKNPLQKSVGGVAQGVGPEFKP